MKKMRIVTILILLLAVSVFQAQTIKRKKIISKKTTSMRSQTKKNNISKVISLGVINGKAINLMKPEFPLAAKAVNVRGSVNVEVLIDEEGNVIEAKAISGHPLLRANSVSAALRSTFEPVILSGIPVKVRGIIVYKYLTGIFNWLEIGNAFGEGSFAEMLPLKFEEVKQLYEQYLTADYENKPQTYQNLQAMIENKLIDNQKGLWLFRVGLFLRKFPLNRANVEDWQNYAIELKNLIAGSPENISQALISKLRNLLNLSENPQLDTYDPRYGSKTYKQIQDIKEKMPMLGN